MTILQRHCAQHRANWARGSPFCLWTPIACWICVLAVPTNMHALPCGTTVKSSCAPRTNSNKARDPSRQNMSSRKLASVIVSQLSAAPRQSGSKLQPPGAQSWLRHTLWSWRKHTVWPAATSAQPCFLNWQKPSSKLQPSNLQNVGFATPKPHATEGRTIAFWTDKKPAPNCSLQSSKTLPNVSFATATPHATEGRTSFVCFPLSWILQFARIGWLQCLLWRAPPCRRRGRRICFNMLHFFGSF